VQFGRKRTGQALGKTHRDISSHSGNFLRNPKTCSSHQYASPLSARSRPTRLFSLVVCLVAVSMALKPDQAFGVTPRWSDDELARLASVILTGQVVDIRTGRDFVTGAIYTYVAVAVDEVIKGEVPEREVILKQSGGLIGNDGLAVVDQAAFTRNEEVLLLLESRPRDGTLYTAALWEGKWSIQRDVTTGERIATRDHHGGDGRGILRDSPDRRGLSSFLDRVRAGSRSRIPESSRRQFVVTPSAEELAFTVSALRNSISTSGLPTAWRWNEFDSGTPIPVDITAGGQPGLTGGGYTELTRAMAVWSGATGLTFALAGTTTRCFGGGAADGHTSIVFSDPCGEISDSGATLAIAGASYTYAGGETVNGVPFARALAGYIVNQNGGAALQYLQNSGCFTSVQTHELGHVLGLVHSANPAAIMYSTLAFSTCSAGAIPASGDDLSAIRLLYPPLSQPGALSPVSQTSVPGPPAGLIVSAFGSTVTMGWAAPSAGEAPTSYVVEAGSRSGRADLASVSTGSSAITFSASGVGAGSYYVRVKAANAAGMSAASNEVVVAVAGGCATAPSPPGGLTITANSGGTVGLQWNAASGNPTTYIIEAGSAPDATNLANSDLGGTATSLMTAGVRPGAYYIRVRGKNECGVGPKSNEVRAVVE
jgi:hypothetical protein